MLVCVVSVLCVRVFICLGVVIVADCVMWSGMLFVFSVFVCVVCLRCLLVCSVCGMSCGVVLFGFVCIVCVLVCAFEYVCVSWL